MYPTIQMNRPFIDYVEHVLRYHPYVTVTLMAVMFIVVTLTLQGIRLLRRWSARLIFGFTQVTLLATGVTNTIYLIGANQLHLNTIGLIAIAEILGALLMAVCLVACLTVIKELHHDLCQERRRTNYLQAQLDGQPIAYRPQQVS